MAECFHNKFYGEQCREPAVYVSTGLQNIVDGWTWCLKHPPSKEFRRLLTPRAQPGVDPDTEP